MADSDDNVAENRRRALESLGYQPDQLVFIRHEHGTKLLRAQANLVGEDQTADAAVNTHRDLVIGQGTADCPTLILSDRAKTFAALIHAGWRGLHKGVIAETVKALPVKQPSDLVVGVGPMACGKHYEFGPEAIELFTAEYVTKRDGTHFLDMPRLVRDQLQSAGVRDIDDIGICTIEDEHFFSYRRDKDARGECGRFFTLAAL
jgi:YfiH family protein